MKTIFALVLISLVGAQAQAQSKTFTNRCRLNPLLGKENPKHFPDVVFGDDLPIEVKSMPVTIPLDPSAGGGFGTTTVRTADILIEQNIRYLDMDKKIIERPIRIKIQISEPKPVAGKKVLQQAVLIETEVYNAATGQMDVVQDSYESSIHFQLPYVERIQSFPVSSVPGQPVGYMLFCDLAEGADSMGGNRPGKKGLNDVAQP